MRTSEVRGTVVERIAGDVAVSKACGGRVYADAAPRDARIPLVTVRRIGFDPQPSMSDRARMGITRLQVTIFTSDPSHRDVLADAVRDVLEGVYLGTGGAISSVDMEVDDDDYIVVDDSGPDGMWIARFTAAIHHSVESEGAVA